MRNAADVNQQVPKRRLSSRNSSGYCLRLWTGTQNTSEIQ